MPSSTVLLACGCAVSSSSTPPRPPPFLTENGRHAWCWSSSELLNWLNLWLDCCDRVAMFIACHQATRTHYTLMLWWSMRCLLLGWDRLDFFWIFGWEKQERTPSRRDKVNEFSLLNDVGSRISWSATNWAAEAMMVNTSSIACECLLCFSYTLDTAYVPRCCSLSNQATVCRVEEYA